MADDGTFMHYERIAGCDRQRTREIACKKMRTGWQMAAHSYAMPPVAAPGLKPRCCKMIDEWDDTTTVSFHRSEPGEMDFTVHLRDDHKFRFRWPIVLCESEPSALQRAEHAYANAVLRGIPSQ